jgi:hypothetical protein
VDDATVKAEAREYVEHIARRSHQGRACIPERAFERAIRAAAASTKELHAAVEMAQRSKETPE